MPLLLKEAYPNGSVVAVWQIEESEEQLLEIVEPGSSELYEYSGFSNELRKLQWLAVRALFKEISGITQGDAIVYSSKKPFLFDGSWHISISHSGNMAAVIINKKKAVGIDVEQLSDKVYKIRQKYLSKEEVISFGKDDLVEKLNIAWCAKEALYKYLGRQNVIFAENLCIQPFDLMEAGELEAEILFPDLVNFVTMEYRRIGDYYLVHFTGE
ncbi:MAG: 4'-phosphopantetheinyl transferase superfamily protein [Bacteroidetes bacterium]|nr:4'-phosphopantetheinyl transferase superfamily protein [Bacteroidota bacterium]MBU1717488.1 4'-phosphopantetheinyl transferase superfamily protein [Bacteroidota bacterium]